MSDSRAVSLTLRQARYQQKMFWRNAAAAMFTFLFPLMFLVIFSTLNGGERIKSRGGITFVTYFMPGILAFGIISATYTNLAIGTVFQREEGILKRIRGTPIPPWAFMAGNVLSSLAVGLLLTVITLFLGIVVYGVTYQAHTTLGLLAALVVGSACFCALGLAVSGFVPNADSAPAIVNFAVFPLVFVSGIFFPMDGAPAWLQNLAKAFPVRPLADALQYVFDPRTKGSGVNGVDLAVMGAWFLAGLVIARRSFRWT